MGEGIHNNCDDLSFEGIFKLHHRRVYALCLRMTGNVAEAEDLTQEVFVQVFRKLESFRGDAAFSTWLHRLTVNQVLMHFRKTRVRKEQTTRNGELPDEPVESGKRFSRPPVLDRIMLNEVITRLPFGYRIVFILHDVKGFRHDEIARELGCSVGTSKSQLHMARMKLREMITRRGAPRNAAAVIGPDPVN